MDNKKETWANAHSQLWASPMKRSFGSRTQSDASSIASSNRDRSLLDDSLVYHQPPRNTHFEESRQHIYQPKNKTLLQVSDILEGYGTVTCDADIPTVLLKVVEELEQAKRDHSFKDLLLREYADTVQRRFSLYGEESPPTVTEVSAKLKDDTPARSVLSPTPPWLEEPLNKLWHTVRDTMQTCFEKSVELSTPLLLPDARRSKENVSQLLRASCEELSELGWEYATAKAAVMKKMESAPFNTTSRHQLSLSAALAELEAHQEPTSVFSQEKDLSAFRGSHTIADALQSIIDTIPASLQIHFNLQVPEAPVLSRCKNLTELVQFLLAEYLSMERYMEAVEAERQKLADVFALSSLSKTDTNDSSGDLHLDEALSRSLRSLQDTVASVVKLPHHISEEDIALRRISTQAIDELAQLLVDSRRGNIAAGSGVPHSVSTVRVEPPTRNLMDMVELIKSRFAMMMAQQQRKELAGAQSRAGLAHMEEAMAKHGKQVVQLLRDLCAAQEDSTTSIEASEQLLLEGLCNIDLDRNITPAKLDNFLADVVERLRVVKTKYQKALHSAAAGKARVEAASQKSIGLQRRLQKVAAVVEHIGRDNLGLSLPFTPVANPPASPGEADDTGKGREESYGSGPGDGVSTLRRLNLRPTSDPITVTKTPSVSTAKDGRASDTHTSSAVVTEHNVVEALQVISSRIGEHKETRNWAAVQDELAQLRAGERRWKADTSVFHEAMAMLMQRLATNGQMVKRTLFLLGTDESPQDELLEEVLRRGGEEQLGNLSADTEYVERTLAELLQKYNRWAQRLQQTTEDHLYTQRKIVKYFAAVCRFFASSQSRTATCPPDDLPEDNLYDIDSCLMRAADVILPALDAAIQTAAQESRPTPSTVVTEAPANLPPMVPSSVDADTHSVTSRQETLVQLARDSAASCTGGVLPYDHRIARLYEMVTRLYTTVTSLLQVHYLCIPSGSRRRSSGEVELMFDGDADNGGFVDIDLDRLLRVSQQQTADSGASAWSTRTTGVSPDHFSREEKRQDDSGGKAPATPPNTIAANNDVILRVTYQNMEVVQDALKRFSANHKMAAILIQKDVDTMHQLLVGMLERYSEMDLGSSSGQTRETLHELYVTLRDRGQRQRSCYFFNRTGGEGSCVWVAALEQLASGCRIVADRSAQCTNLAADYHKLVGEVVVICSTYVDWAKHSDLPASRALPSELLALPLQRSCEGTADMSDATTTTAAAAGGSSRNQRDEEARVSGKSATGGTTKATTAAAQRPPNLSGMPPLTPRAPSTEQQQSSHGVVAAAAAAVPTVSVGGTDANTSCFTDDGVVRRVLEHMFQLARWSVEVSPPAGGGKAGNATDVLDADADVRTPTEEMHLLRETVATAERRIAELNEAQHALKRERDQAQSEAAVARAELRRWKRQQRQQQEQQHTVNMPIRGSDTPERLSPPSPRGVASARQSGKTTTTADGADAVMDEATAKEVIEYMRVLSEELLTAKQRANKVTAHHLLQSPSQAAVSLRQSGARSRNYTGIVKGEHLGESSSVDGIDSGRDSPPADLRHARRPRRSLTELAKELRHQYESTEIAPMVVIDPHTHSYSGTRRQLDPTRQGSGVTSQMRSRDSPLKYQGPAYDACARYCARTRTPASMREGEDAVLSHSASVYTSPHHWHQQPYSHVDATRASSVAVASQHRYPRRSLSRDEPLLPRGNAGVSKAIVSPHVYHAPQRATSATEDTASSPHLSPPLTSASTRLRRSRSTPTSSPARRTHMHHSRSHYDNGSHRARGANTGELEDTQGGRDAVCTPGTPRTHTGQQRATSSGATAQPYRQPPTRRVSRAATSHLVSAALPSPATASLTSTRRGFDSNKKQLSTLRQSQQRRPVVRDDLSRHSENVGESLAVAVQQIDAATQRPASTPMRLDTQTGSGRDAHRESFTRMPSTSTPESFASVDHHMSRNANLRATALRRLAEVISQTAVPSARRRRM